MRNYPKYATVPDDADCNYYLTAGKTYEIVEHVGHCDTYGQAFTINSDLDEIAYCLELCCGHLNEKGWILSNEKPEHRRIDDKDTKKLKAVSVLLFALIVCACLFGL